MIIVQVSVWTSEWNKLSEHKEHQILVVSRRVLKQCYLHNNMDADCKNNNVLWFILVLSLF